MTGILVIIGVMVFLWATAVIATAGAFVITEGRLRPTELRQVLLAGLSLIALAAGYFLLAPTLDSEALPPPSDAEVPTP